MMQHKQFIDNWVESILANPVTKQPCDSDSFEIRNGVVDARVYLKNSPGYHAWLDGQDEYEDWAKSDDGYDNKVENHTKEIEYDKPVYDQFEISGDFLDCGGGVSTVREFLPPDVRSVSLDPYINAPFEVPKARFEAYKSLSSPLNFLAANAEFLPFRHQSFDWVHMRSMLDHVQVPDLCLKEAHRVLKNEASLLVGAYVEGGKSGKRKEVKRFIKDLIKEILEHIGIEKYKDHHVWRPTYSSLIKLITDNGFEVVDEYWQPHFKDTVVYIRAKKIS